MNHVMTEQEIIKEQQATGINYLMRVGLFYHAYDGAAFALARLTGYQVRRVHRRQGDIFLTGFSATSFDKVRTVLADAGITLQGDGDLWWFEGGDTSEDLSMVSEPKPAKVEKPEADGLLKEVMAFNLSASTPMDAMIFLSNLQRKYGAQ